MQSRRGDFSQSLKSCKARAWPVITALAISDHPYEAIIKRPRKKAAISS